MLKNKILKILLALTPTVQFLTIPFVSSCSKETSNIDGSNWEGVTKGSFAENDYIIDEENLTITYLNAVSIHSYNLVIPNYVKWHKKNLKVYLAPRTFKNNNGIAGTIELNDFMFTVPDECFFGCISLTGIIFHSYPIEIGNLAFCECLLLSEILVLDHGQLKTDWANSLRTIGNFAFSECPSLLGKLVLGNDLTSIGEYAFNRCTGISEVNLQFCFNLGYINNGAFAACSGIEKVYLSKSVIGIGDEAFKGCTYLATVDLPIRYMKISLGDNTFYGCENLRTFTNSPRFTHIGEGCFSFDTNLDLPLWKPEYEVNEIPSFAFASCNKTSLTFEPNNDTWQLNISDYAFSNNRDLAYIDFSAFPPGSPPNWTGLNIFTGCADQGIVILNEGNVWNTEWNEFFDQNGIQISNSSWKIKSKQYKIRSITKPTNSVSQELQEGRAHISIKDFTCETTEGFNPELLRLQFRPYKMKEGQKVYLTITEMTITFNSDFTKFDLDLVIESQETGTFSAYMNFFYHDQKVFCEDDVKFEIVLK